MLDSAVYILSRVLMWMFFIGMAGCALAVIPMTMYKLFKVLFEKDSPGDV